MSTLENQFFLIKKTVNNQVASDNIKRQTVMIFHNNKFSAEFQSKIFQQAKRDRCTN